MDCRAADFFSEKPLGANVRANHIDVPHQFFVVFEVKTQVTKSECADPLIEVISKSKSGLPGQKATTTWPYFRR
jgi:hypothetical protein